VAVTQPVSQAASAPLPAAPVSLRHFARLKLRLMANGFRGRPARVLTYVFGGLFGLYLAGLGFLLFATSAAVDEQARLLIAALGGGALVIGSAVLPLVWFGVDDTLDPARFALLPVSRSQLVSGLLVAALLGVPAAGMLIATLGLLVPAGAHGGGPGAVAQLLGIVAGLLLCLALARAVTSAFASVLRSRRVRDLAWVLIACVAALLGPLQLMIISAVQQADWSRLATVAQVVGWTPLASAYTVGWEIGQGRPLAALAKLVITAVALGLVMWWWVSTVESAVAGAAVNRPTRAGRRVRGGASSQLLPRLLPTLPASPFGALVAREIRYWWRDARRRSSIIMIVVIGLFVPVVVTAGAGGFIVDARDGLAFSLAGTASPVTIQVTMLFISAFTASMLANQFGYEGTAYAAHLIAGVPGRLELLTRATAYSVVMVPLLVVVGVTMAVVQGSPSTALSAWGMLAAGYGAGVAVNQLLSVLAPYPLPETSNPFATGSGEAAAKSMLALLGLALAGAVALPVLLVAMALGDAWPWVALPVGIGYGVGAVALGSYLAGDLLDRRAPELFASVSPKR
jgi:ABC-2 type transport system permease protein